MPNTKRNKYDEALDTLQCVIDELADMIKRHNRQDPETGVWDYDYGGVAEAQKVLGDLRSAFPPPAEDAKKLVREWFDPMAKTLIIDELEARIESFAESRVEPWRDALRGVDAWITEYNMHWRTYGVAERLELLNRMVALQDKARALLSDSPAKEAAK